MIFKGLRSMTMMMLQRRVRVGVERAKSQEMFNLTEPLSGPYMFFKSFLTVWSVCNEGRRPDSREKNKTHRALFCLCVQMNLLVSYWAQVPVCYSGFPGKHQFVCQTFLTQTMSCCSCWLPEKICTCDLATFCLATHEQCSRRYKEEKKHDNKAHA